ncbi:MAG: hypothetical protein HZA08_07820 [Nitrospirae bacterium]|nr:hypothetical protein [Nitrospirota bacterium]
MKNTCTRIIVAFMVILFFFDFFQLCNPAFAADEQEQEETKIEIEIEKQAIVVKIERPSIVFPVKWKNPDFPEEREYVLKQDFMDEIRKITGK